MGDLEELPAMLIELRELIPQAHIVAKDLRQAVREARAEREKILRESVDERLSREVQAGLDRFGEELQEAIEIGTRKVDERFERLTALKLGEDRWAARRGLPSIPEMLEAVVALEKEIPPAFRNSRRKA